jgi:hypothetical protein
MRGFFNWLNRDTSIAFPSPLNYGIVVVIVLCWGFGWTDALVWSIFGFSLSSILASIVAINLRLRCQLTTRVQTRDDHERRTKLRNPKVLLASFAWFCGKDNREHIELVQADLMKDRRDMRRESRSPAFIFAVMLWKVTGTVIPIVWDGILRFLAAILPIAKLISKIKGL